MFSNLLFSFSLELKEIIIRPPPKYKGAKYLKSMVQAYGILILKARKEIINVITIERIKNSDLIFAFSFDLNMSKIKKSVNNTNKTPIIKYIFLLANMKTIE